MDILKISSARCNEERRGTSCRFRICAEIKSSFVSASICLKGLLSEFGLEQWLKSERVGKELSSQIEQLRTQLIVPVGGYLACGQFPGTTFVFGSIYNFTDEQSIPSRHCAGPEHLVHQVLLVGCPSFKV